MSFCQCRARHSNCDSIAYTSGSPLYWLRFGCKPLTPMLLYVLFVVWIVGDEGEVGKVLGSEGSCAQQNGISRIPQPQAWNGR